MKQYTLRALTATSPNYSWMVDTIRRHTKLCGGKVVALCWGPNRRTDQFHRNLYEVAAVCLEAA